MTNTRVAEECSDLAQNRLRSDSPELHCDANLVRQAEAMPIQPTFHREIADDVICRMLRYREFTRLRGVQDDVKRNYIPRSFNRWSQYQ
mmetsp:Transcript_35893/g.89321  ORF Transcript_35893/g.89321 Transcript_35893/m.89321 type:complete len:89 (+) Transcript_35893:608-874(+)